MVWPGRMMIFSHNRSMVTKRIQRIGQNGILGATLRHNAGFTLIEMLMVLVLLAIFASGMAVLFAGRQDTHVLEAAVKDVVASVNYVQNQSKLKHRPYRIHFDIDNGSYQIETASSTASEKYSQVQGISGRRHVLPQGVYFNQLSIDDGNERCWIVSPGKDIPGGEISLLNRRQEGKIIHILPQSGQVQVMELIPEQ